MKVGKGIVKKYSREYNRTLKNGERKKYTTEQIQITVPKHEDIYNNKEEVLIIPQDEIENFKNLEEENHFSSSNMLSTSQYYTNSSTTCIAASPLRGPILMILV